MFADAFCETHPDSVVALGADGTIVYINLSGMALWGFDSKDAAIGKGFAELWPTSDRARIRYAIETGGSTIEGFYVTPTGSRYWLETRFISLSVDQPARERTVCISRDFSASQETRTSLSAEEVSERAQNALYREIIDSAIDAAIIGTDSQGHIILWSQGARQITGWSAEDMLGQPLAIIFTPEDRAAGRPALEMRRADQLGRAADMRWHATKDGRRFYAHGSINPILGPAGGYVKSFRDATQQHLTETALKESEDRYASLFNSIDAGFCIVDIEFDTRHRPVDYRFVEVNPAFAANTGLTAVVGKSIRELVPTIEQSWIDIYAKVAATGEHIRFEKRAEALGDRWYEAYAFRAGNPSLQRVAILFSDISNRKKAEAELRVAQQHLQRLNETLEQRVVERTLELRQSERRFRAYFNASPEYLYLLRLTADDTLVFEDVNPAGAELYGLARGEIIGRSPHEIDDSGAAQNIAIHARKALASGSKISYETSRSFRDRPRVAIDTIVAPVEITAGGFGLVLVCGRDLTEQRQVEDALRQSQKMEAIGQLTGGIAHDFNNLLAAVMGSLELMQGKIKQGRLNELDRYVVAAQAASKRAAALTHRLLAFSRRQTLSPTLTDVNRLIKSMEDLIRRTIGPSVMLEVAETEPLWRTPVDQNQLENALLNLSINARDAMPVGGRVTIETDNWTFDERDARDRDLPAGQYVSLSVTDTGVGMTPDVLSRAFEPFFTTKPLGSGTGLGLSMIYGFVRQSGGQVRLYSEVGRGTTVTIYLPRFMGKADSLPADPRSIEPPRAKPGETVLVVDDEELVRMLIVEVLNDLGYASLEAADGPEGLKIMKTDCRIDLLVTDVGLPNGMNGRQLADAALSLRPNLKVLFITGYAENAVINHGHLEPGMQIMTKPFQIEALGLKIRSMFEDND